MARKVTVLNEGDRVEDFQFILNRNLNPKNVLWVNLGESG